MADAYEPPRKLKRVKKTKLARLGRKLKRQSRVAFDLVGYTLLALKPAAQFAAYEPAKAMWLARQGPGAELGAIASFCLGAYSRAVSDSVTCALPLSRGARCSRATVS